MCAIVGSFNQHKLHELIALNSYRGSHSYSFSTISPHGDLKTHVRSLGTFDPTRTDCQIPPGHYAIAHIQAPTTEANSIEDIHPSRELFNQRLTALWHNGIVKANHVKKMQETFGSDTNWDTQLLLRAVNANTDNLNEVDGSFSCLWWDGSSAYLFRNDISPMFYDSELNISSTKFEGSISTPANKILFMNLAHKALYNTGEFKTVENPYFFGDEI